MTQEHKELLLRDLCTRLPYGVKYDCRDIKNVWKLNSILTERQGGGVFLDIYNPLELCKPYLFPLSSMTSELWVKEFSGFGITRDFFEYDCESLEFNDCNPDLSNMIGFINQLIKNHFDVNGLIPLGLAINATGLDIY